MGRTRKPGSNNPQCPYQGCSGEMRSSDARAIGYTEDATYARTRTYVCKVNTLHTLKTVEVVRDLGILIRQSSGLINEFDELRAVKSVSKAGHDMDFKDARNIVNHGLDILKRDFTDGTAQGTGGQRPYKSKMLGLSILKAILDKGLYVEWVRYSMIFFDLQSPASVPDMLKKIHDIHSLFLFWEDDSRQTLLGHAEGAWS